MEKISKTKKSQYKHLLYFFVAGLFLVLIVFNTVKVESLEGFLKFFTAQEEVEVEIKPSAEEETFVLTGCNLRACAGDRFDDHSINYGILSRMVIEQFYGMKEYEDCDDYIAFMEENEFITWKEGYYLNDVVSRKIAVRVLTNVYNSLKTDDSKFEYELSHPQISASKTWTEDVIKEVLNKLK